MMSETQGSQLVGRNEAARILGVHPATIYRWTRKGLLSVITLPSGIHRYDVERLEAIRKGQAQPKA